MQPEIQETKWQKFRGFIRECRRVLRITHKPSGDEFKTILKVSAIGITVIGMLGFAIQTLKLLITR